MQGGGCCHFCAFEQIENIYLNIYENIVIHNEEEWYRLGKKYYRTESKH